MNCFYLFSQKPQAHFSKKITTNIYLTPSLYLTVCLSVFHLLSCSVYFYGLSVLFFKLPSANFRLFLTLFNIYGSFHVVHFNSPYCSSTVCHSSSICDILSFYSPFSTPSCSLPSLLTVRLLRLPLIWSFV